MDTDTKSRRTLNYFRDLLNKLISVNKGITKQSYEEIYRQYDEAKKYVLLNEQSDDDLQQHIHGLPELIAPSIFNRNIGGILTLALIGGFSNPFVTILILTFSFPVSLPYLAIRTVIVRKTKSKNEEAIHGLTRIVNRLNARNQK